MAEFRNIHSRIWKDPWFSTLPAEQKMVFIYLFSNERASICGMYELPIRFIAFECGLSEDAVAQAFEAFEKAEKAYYRDGLVWVVNLRKYNEMGDSPKIRTRIEKDLDLSPDCELKRRYYAHHQIPYLQIKKTPDTLSIEDGVYLPLQQRARQHLRDVRIAAAVYCF